MTRQACTALQPGAGHWPLWHPSPIDELLDRGRCLSFEFFPPRTLEAEARLARTLEELALLEPSFVSVTAHGVGLSATGLDPQPGQGVRRPRSRLSRASSPDQASARTCGGICLAA